MLRNTQKTAFGRFFQLAEREGVEPSIPFGITAFQAIALGHYATSPSKCRIAYYKAKIKLFGLILVIDVLFVDFTFPSSQFRSSF